MSAPEFELATLNTGVRAQDLHEEAAQAEPAAGRAFRVVTSERPAWRPQVGECALSATGNGASSASMAMR